MKSLGVVLGVVLLLAVTSPFTFAHCGVFHLTEAFAEEGAIEVGNKICPVSEEEIKEDEMEPFKVEYNGKIYNLCCKACAKDFKKDPEKYIEKLEELEPKESEHYGHEHHH